MPLAVLLVHDDPTPTTGDNLLKTWLESGGHTVTMRSETLDAPASGYDVVVMGSSIAATVPAKYANVSYGFLNMEIGGWTSTGLTNVNGASVGADGGVYMLNSHSITVGLTSPTDFTGTSGSSGVAVSTLASGAEAVALSSLDTNNTVLFVADAGATLHTGTAAGRRACLGWTDGNLAQVNTDPDGIDLFLRVVDWLGGATVVVPKSGAAWTGAAPTFVGATVATTASPDFTIDAPTGVQDGDIQMVLVVIASDDEPITDIPPGWVQLAHLDHWHGNPDGNSATHSAHLFVTDSDTGSATFHRDFYTGNRMVHGYRAAYRGATGWLNAVLANTDDPSDGGPFTSHPIPEFTLTTPAAVIVGIGTEDTSLPSFTPPPGFIERVENQLNDPLHDDPLVVALADKLNALGVIQGSFVSDFACYGSVFSLALDNAPALRWTGAADGTAVFQGTAETTVDWVGTASGERPKKGSASAGYFHAGSAAGKRVAGGRTNTITHSYQYPVFLVTVTGVMAPVGSATGDFRFTAVIPNTGSATGGYALAGSAAGSAAGGGTGTGGYAFAGSATGKASRIGAASGAAAWTGGATGVRAVIIGGGTTGGYQFSGSGAGQVVTRGSVSGTFAFDLRRPTYRFEPPTYEAEVPRYLTGGPRYRLTYSTSVVRLGGTLRTVQTPTGRQLTEAGIEGRDWFLGGHVYPAVSGLVASELLAAGFAPIENDED